MACVDIITCCAVTTTTKHETELCADNTVFYSL